MFIKPAIHLSIGDSLHILFVLLPEPLRSYFVSTMASQTTDTDLFTRLAKLPPNVIALIVDNLLKCILPPLLYFPPIQETTIAILSHVTDRVWNMRKLIFIVSTTMVVTALCSAFSFLN